MDETMPELTLLERKTSPTINRTLLLNPGTEETYKSKVEDLKKSSSDVHSPSKAKNGQTNNNFIQAMNQK